MTPSELKAWRTTHGLTQKELAAQLEVGVTTVARWEQGLSPISKTVSLALEAIGHSLNEV